MIEKDVGRHGAQIEELQRNVKSLTEKVDKLSAEIAEIHDILTQARGGWKMMLLIGGAAGAVIAFVFKVFGLWRATRG